MKQETTTTPEDPQSDPSKKYLRTLIKSGYKGELVESGQNNGMLEEGSSENPQSTAEVSQASDATRSQALKLLGFVEEYFLRADSESDQVLALQELSSEHSLESLLEKLENGPSKSTEGETASAQHTIKQQIKLLLAAPGVKQYFFKILKGEVESFKKAQPTLEKVSLLQRLRARITSETTKMYLRDHRSKGKLLATTAKAISHLEAKSQEAGLEERRLTATADKKTKSWLMVQELLGYKKELRETGFAKTESRKNLIKRVLSDMAHGKKVFLVGSTGTGKTQLAMLVADLVNSEGFEVVSWHQGTTPRDLFGYREVSQDEKGIKSDTKKGPVAIAITQGRIVIHDEYTAGSTRAQLSAKAQMNAKAGQKTRLPGFNGEVFTVGDDYGEIFTGNIKDDRTKAREDMDPAILRMLKGVKVSFMPATELYKVILSELIDDTGLMPLSKEDAGLIKKLTQAAELMQMCHDREIDKLTSSPHKDLIAGIFGNRLDEVHLDKSFLDTGTLLDIFKGWELEKARGKKFFEFLAEELTKFLEDPKFDMDKEERRLAQKIIEICGLSDSALAKTANSDTPYILPSEIGDLFDEPLIDDDINAEGDGQDANLKPDQKEGLDTLVKAQYRDAIDLLEKVQLVNSQDLQSRNCPSEDKVKSLLAHLGPTQLEEIKQMREPVLQLVPVRTCSEYKTALNRNKPMVNANGELQQDMYVSDWMKKAFTREDARDKAQKERITKWQIVITEGANAPGVQAGDDASKLISERLQAFNNTKKPHGITGINAKSYMLLQMRGFAKIPPLPVDDVQGTDNTWTILSPEDNEDGRVGGGYWFDVYRRVYLNEGSLDLQHARARFRSSVVVDVL